MPHPSAMPLLPPVTLPATPVDEDTALVVAAQHDRPAFAPLYLRYVTPVYRYCHRRLGSPETAEDATSLVFAKALAALPRYCVDGPSFRSWLFTIAHNVVIDIQRTTRVTDSVANIVTVADPAPGPEATVLAAEDARTVHALLQEMAPDQRQVLELRLAGLTTTEISAVLGRQPGAVRAIQCRAVARLRSLLGGVPHEKESEDAASDA